MENTPKRIRFSTAVDNDTSKPPSFYANQLISDHLSTLLPTIASLTSYFWRDYFKLQQNCTEINNKLQKMNTTEYVPKSANINFSLGGTKDVTESLDFTTLKTETITAIDDFKKTIKTKILKATKLEYTAAHNKVRHLFAEACNKLAHITLISKQQDDTPVLEKDVHKLVMTTLQTSPLCLQEVYMTYAEFMKIYRSKYPENQPDTIMIDTTPITTTTTTKKRPISSLKSPPGGPTESPFFSQSNKRPPTTDSDSITITDLTVTTITTTPALQANTISIVIATTLYKVFTTAWVMYREHTAQRKIDLQLYKFYKETIQTNITESTILPVNEEPTLTSATMNKLIEDKVNK